MTSDTEIVPVELEDGVILLVRVTAIGGYVDTAVEMPTFKFTQVARQIESVAKLLITTFKKTQPNKATVEMGLELAYEGGQLTALLAQGSATASLKITLEWEQEKLEEK